MRAPSSSPSPPLRHPTTLLSFLLLSFSLCICTNAQVPTLDDLAGEWKKYTLLRDTPALSNWRGSVGTNVDVIDATSFIVPPFISGTSMLTMHVDGRALELDEMRWSAFAAERKSKPVIVEDHTITVTSEMRMAWNDTALLWKITLENNLPTYGRLEDIDYDDIVHDITFSVQAQARRLQEMGWLLETIPQNPAEFRNTLIKPNEKGARAMVIHADTLVPGGDAVSGFAFVDRAHAPYEWEWVKDPQGRNRSAAVAGINLVIAPGEQHTLRLVAAIGTPVSESFTEEQAVNAMINRLDVYADNFEAYFAGARSGWEKVWEDAFTPPFAREDIGAGRGETEKVIEKEQVFSGFLPVLRTTDMALHRLYYMGVLSLLTLGRTSLDAYSEGVEGLTSFITGFGSTCWTRGDLRPAEVDCLKPGNPRDTLMTPVMIGASAQFYWDTSLRAALTSLLDPAAMRRYILSFFNLRGKKFERSFGLDAMTGAPIGYEYAFNSVSIFTIVSMFVKVTNDTLLLREEVGGEGETVGERLEEVALDWMRRRMPKPASSAMVAEKKKKRKGQAAKTKPSSDELFAFWPFSSSSQGKKEGPGGEEEDEFFYLSDYGGDINNFLECIPSYIHATPGLQAGNAEMMGSLADLREAQGNTTGAHRLRFLASGIVNDTIQHLYVKGGEGVWGCLYPDYSLVPVRHVIDFIYISRGFGSMALPTEIKNAMTFFFQDELQTSTWLRALSPSDKLNLKVPRPKSVLRADHGITGAFDAWASGAVEALAILNDGNWEIAMPVLRHMATTTLEGPFGQAHEVSEIDQTFKTKRGFTRYAADNGASFAEVILRGLFGYEPPFLAVKDGSLPFKGLEKAIKNQKGSRGDLAGMETTLEGLWTPWGVATLGITAGGVEIKHLFEIE